MRSQLLLWKRIIFVVALHSSVSYGQLNQAYQFSDVIRIQNTPVKNQLHTNICWSYSAASFLENELVRLGKPAVDLSETFVARCSFMWKAENYLRKHGLADIRPGGLSSQAFALIHRFGIVPNQIYPERVDVNMDSLGSAIKTVLDGYLARSPLKADWRVTIDSLLDKRLGSFPVRFTYQGRTYSPLSFAQELNLPLGDYVGITSFTHHPYYTTFILEIPDNWDVHPYLNVPLDEFMGLIKTALKANFTLTADIDVTNNGYSHGFSHRYGLALVPISDRPKTAPGAFTTYEQQKTITPAYRQELFDGLVTQDDHLVQLTGLAQDQHQRPYFIIKDSVGDFGPYKGYVYASEAYLRLNLVSIFVHKSALPSKLQRYYERLSLAE